MPSAGREAPAIPDELIEFRQIRASGPGGQNVNKVSNAVQLRFAAARWTALWPAARTRLARLAGRRQNDAGEIVIEAQRFRSLERNKADARARLESLIAAALIEPVARRKTRPSRAAQERRLASKSRAARIKRLRRRATPDD